MAYQCLQEGADDYMLKPIRLDYIKVCLGADSPRLAVLSAIATHTHAHARTHTLALGTGHLA